MMFIKAPIEHAIKPRGELETKINLSEKKFHTDLNAILEEVITELSNGVLILTERKEIIYANNCACRILRRISQDRVDSDSIPKEIWYVCKSIIEVRALFPEQHWLINTEIYTGGSSNFDVQARCLKLEKPDMNCVILLLKDQYQIIKNIASEEAEEYGLTDREKEIWIMQRANYNYKQIASELFIAPNTVKKHLQNISLKKKLHP